MCAGKQKERTGGRGEKRVGIQQPPSSKRELNPNTAARIRGVVWSGREKERDMCVWNAAQVPDAAAHEKHTTHDEPETFFFFAFLNNNVKKDIRRRGSPDNESSKAKQALSAAGAGAGKQTRPPPHFATLHSLEDIHHPLSLSLSLSLSLFCDFFSSSSSTSSFRPHILFFVSFNSFFYLCE